MEISLAYRAFLASGIAVIFLSGCAQFAGTTGPQPTSNATSIEQGVFGPARPQQSGFSSSGNVVVGGSTGVFGTTDAITVDNSGPFPDNTSNFDPSLSDLSAEDQALLAGSAIDFAAETALASALTFPGDDGSAAFFDADIGTTVYFDTNSASLSDEARAVLRSQAAWLNVHPETIATIEGHTDERGTREFNIALGERRASAARGYLTALGVATSRVRKVSFGKERPAIVGSNQDAWSQNRRAVTTISRQNSSIASVSSDNPLPRSPLPSDTSIDALLNDPVLNDFPSGDPLLNDPLLNDPLLNDPLLNDV